MENAAEQGEYLLGKLRAMQERFDCIGEVRGKGLWIGVELVKSRACKTPDAGLSDRVLTRGFHNGILLLNCGQSTLRLMPPLMIDRATADEALVLLERSLHEALEH
jgi:4-aminobutyrate aminotransferase